MIKLIQKYIEVPTAVNISASIERCIGEGEIAPGAVLPPIRALAEGLGVSPGTVSAAYRRLKLRGAVVSEGRRGTRVAPQPEAEPLGPPVGSGVVDLAVGNPDAALLPPLAGALQTLDASPVLYGDPLCHPPFEAWLKAQFEAEGIPCEGLAIVGGAMDGLERILRLELAPGDRVAVADPAFSGTLTLLRSLGLSPVPVALDDRGLLPQALEAALGVGVRAVITVPRAQNPTGAALDAPRAEALAAVLGAHPGALYIEDDHAGPVAGAPAITACRPGRGRQIVVRSFSKSLGPDLRVAVVAGDGVLIERLRRQQAVGIRWVSHLLQRLAYAMLTDTAVQAGLGRAASMYTCRREALISALAAVGIPATGASGLNVWVPVPDEARVVQGLWAAGYAVAPGSHYRLKTPPAIRVTISALPEADAGAFARALAGVLTPGGRSAPA